jgi:putative membrane protein
MRQWLGVYVKGMAMGAADVVPGVSGGTVAFITGIYEQLLSSIKSINLASVKLLFREGPVAFWREINASFLLVLLAGIATSVFSLAKLISALLLSQPILVWSFFFGLIIASAIHMGKTVKGWGPSLVLSLVLGAVAAYAFTELKPLEVTLSPLVYFLAGSIAICAMILPGVSGSFLLVLMGMYKPVLTAVKELDLLTIAYFGGGAVVGLLLFANLLSWLLSRFHNMTLSFLIGFLFGSLNLVWPWKLTVESYQDRHGVLKPLIQENVLPQTFEYSLSVPSQLPVALICAACGLGVVFVLEWSSRYLGKKT